MTIDLTEVENLQAINLKVLQMIMAHEDVRRYLPFKAPPSLADVEKLVGIFMPKENHLWKIESDNELIGIIDLISIDEKTASLAYILKFNSHGKGIMSYALSEVISLCFRNLQISSIKAPVVSRNKASRNLLKKMGFLLIEEPGKRVNFDGDDDEVLTYMLKRKTIYVSDLDSTLLQPDANLSPFAVKNLNNLISKGVLFTASCGLSPKIVELG